jgi:hypothetical protein
MGSLVGHDCQVVEQALLGAGKAVVTRVAARWLADRSAERQRTAELSSWCGGG